MRKTGVELHHIAGGAWETADGTRGYFVSTSKTTKMENRVSCYRGVNLKIFKYSDGHVALMMVGFPEVNVDAYVV